MRGGAGGCSSAYLIHKYDIEGGRTLVSFPVMLYLTQTNNITILLLDVSIVLL